MFFYSVKDQAPQAVNHTWQGFLNLDQRTVIAGTAVYIKITNGVGFGQDAAIILASLFVISRIEYFIVLFEELLDKWVVKLSHRFRYLPSDHLIPDQEVFADIDTELGIAAIKNIKCADQRVKYPVISCELLV
jgi:hypothetical protein